MFYLYIFYTNMNASLTTEGFSGIITVNLSDSK